MNTSKVISLLCGAALLGFGVMMVGLTVDAFVLTAFSGTVVALLVLAIVRDYAPRAQRFEPRPNLSKRRHGSRSLSVSGRHARYPLAA